MEPVNLTGPVPQFLLNAQPDLTSLKDQSVLITGGAAGFGAALVRQCAEAGAHVTLADIREQDGQKLVDALQSEGHHANFVRCDVTSWPDQVAAFKAAVRFGPGDGDGRLDHVVVNAGTAGVPFFVGTDTGVASLDEDPPEPNVSPIRVNLLAATYTLKLAQLYLTAPLSGAMRPGCSKSVLLVASGEAYASIPGTVVYSGSKFGLRGIFRSSREMFAAKGVRVNQICPWAMDTDIGAKVKPAMKPMGMEFRSVGDHVAVAMHLLCSRHANEDATFGPVGGEERQIAGRSVALAQGGVTLDLCDDSHGADGGPKIAEAVGESMPGFRQRMVNVFTILGFRVDEKLRWIF